MAAGSAYSAVLVWQLPVDSRSLGPEGPPSEPEHHMCQPLYVLQGHNGVIHRCGL